MANPQKENGFVSIATELFERICSAPLSGSEFRIMLFTIRKTYGFQKKQDWISLSQYALGTGLSRRHVIRTLNRLVVSRTLLKSKNGSVYGLNKNYSEWGSGQLTTGGSDQTGQKVVVNQPPTIDTIQKINTRAKARTTMKKNRMGSYREDRSTDSHEEVVDFDTGEVVKEKRRTSRTPEYKALLSWSEQERGKKFMPHLVAKQFKAFMLAREYGISDAAMKGRWRDLAGQKFWAENGFDWMNVIDSFNKKPK